MSKEERRQQTLQPCPSFSRTEAAPFSPNNRDAHSVCKSGVMELKSALTHYKRNDRKGVKIRFCSRDA